MVDARSTGSAEPAQSSAAVDGMLARLRAGDETAFRELVREHQPSLLRLAAARTGRPDVAEEVVQEAWSVFLRSLSRFEGRSSIRTWLCGIVVNCARSRVRSEARSVPLSALQDEGAPEPAVPSDRFLSPDHRWAGHWQTPPTPFPQFDALVSDEVRSVIRKAVAILPPAQQEVFVLRDIEGAPAEEVCNVLGVSDTHQRVLLHRARARVRQALERHFGETHARA